MKTIAERNSDGVVSLEGGRITATVPKTRSMLGIVGVNGVINGAEYKEDGYVYLNGERVRKWHIMHDQIRLWEPRLNDLKDLHRIWKQTSESNSKHWNKIMAVVTELWSLRNKHKSVVIAHAFPHYPHDDKWWSYNINNYGGNLGFSFGWIDKPKKLVNPALGQKLCDLEYYSKSTGNRQYKAQQIFFHAMIKSLPKAEENQTISLQFEEKYFYFISVNNNGYIYWEMLQDNCTYRNIKIV